MFFTLLLFASIAHAGPAIRGWKQTDAADGILIFEQQDPSGFLAFQASGIVEAPVHAVAAAILDSKHTPEWVDHLEEDRVIRRQGGKFLEYTHVSTPIVLKDRDFLCEVTVSVSGDSLLIASHSVEDAAEPPTSYVRGVVVSNEFRLTPLKGGRTRLKGEFHIDPKGSVAKWIVNLFQHAWPKKAFRGIQKRAAEGTSSLPVEIGPILKALPNP
jgi:hypothetical protein